MKKFCIIILMFFQLSGCKNSSVDINQIVTNSTLQNCLNKIIAHEDSMLTVYSTYGIIKSFTVTFSQENLKCYVELIADFDIYDSHAMDGYFLYKGKYVSIYGLSSKCGDNFINRRKLKLGLIPVLYDLDNRAFELAIKQGLPPPPPPPPREPFYRKYLISSPDTFVKVKDDDDDVKNFEQNRYLK